MVFYYNQNRIQFIVVSKLYLLPVKDSSECIHELFFTQFFCFPPQITEEILIIKLNAHLKLDWSDRPFVEDSTLQLKLPNSYHNYFHFKPPIFQFTVENSRILGRKTLPPQFVFSLEFICKSYICLFWMVFCWIFYVWLISLTLIGKLSNRKKNKAILIRTIYFCFN